MIATVVLDTASISRISALDAEPSLTIASISLAAAWARRAASISMKTVSHTGVTSVKHLLDNSVYNKDDNEDFWLRASTTAPVAASARPGNRPSTGTKRRRQVHKKGLKGQSLVREAHNGFGGGEIALLQMLVTSRPRPPSGSGPIA